MSNHKKFALDLILALVRAERYEILLKGLAPVAGNVATNIETDLQMSGFGHVARTLNPHSVVDIFNFGRLSTEAYVELIMLHKSVQYLQMQTNVETLECHAGALGWLAHLVSALNSDLGPLVRIDAVQKAFEAIDENLLNYGSEVCSGGRTEAEGFNEELYQQVAAWIGRELAK